VLVLNGRGSGLLLPITSLPSRFGIGDLGPPAYRFVDFLYESRQKYWQILPLNPTSGSLDNSPYKSTSANACNTLLISPELLARDGFLQDADLKGTPPFPESTVEYPAVGRYKAPLFSRAYEQFRAGKGDPAGYEMFCRDNSWWLPDFALFSALHRKYGDRAWNEWPEEIRCRKPDAVAAATQELARGIGQEQFLQFIFHTQWQALHTYCEQKGIRIIGDIPIYVDYDSVDVWTHPELFRLDAALAPDVVAGVPPDYFSKTGQLWKNPLYDWNAHKKTGFSWWLRRLGRALVYTDEVRIDHFRGLVAYWEVPAKSDTAVNGRWVVAPAKEFLSAVRARFPQMPVIAEDLGIITPEVREIMAEFGLPGMRILLFAFTDDLPKNPHAPHNIPKNVLLYTGTHDNAPVRGWYEEEAKDAGRERVRQYLGPEVNSGNLPGLLVRLAMISCADTAIIPVQDLLGLGLEARMNIPGTKEGNWQWRLPDGNLTHEVADRLRTLTMVCNRA
jgi:4-alpha-glucanotransferase